MAGRVARGLAHRAGFELIRRGPTPETSPAGLETETIPAGRTAPFSTAHYDVVPRGQYDIVRHDYYSPVPDLSSLPEEVWARRSPLRGVDLATSAAIEFVETELASVIAELDVPLDSPGVAGEFFLRNDAFGTVDAELLYGIVRAMRPRKVIELGSGYSSLLIALACRLNAAQGVPTTHVAYDPYPRPHVLGDSPPEPTTVLPVSATDVPIETFAALEAGDVLFVDTTHTVKLASDVNFIVLDVLPALAPGVVVHFHDVFLPWEYPRRWFTEMQYYWAEQYLLQAFLAFNSAFEILVPAHALAREYPDRLRRVIPSFAPGAAPGSLWLRRR